MTELLGWNVYEISARESSLNGVMLRGRIRKYGLENSINVLTENKINSDFLTLTYSLILTLLEYALELKLISQFLL